MKIEQEKILEALGAIRHPGTKEGIVAMTKRNLTGVDHP